MKRAAKLWQARYAAAFTIIGLSSVGTHAAPVAVAPVCMPVIIHRDLVTHYEYRIRSESKVTFAPSGSLDATNGFAWPDTQLGIVKNAANTAYLTFASDGGCHSNCGTPDERDGSFTRTVTQNLGNPLQTDKPIAEFILQLQTSNLSSAIAYVGGGPVFRVPAGNPGAGNLLMVYHAEHVQPAHQQGLYSYLGIAKSMDDGETWTDLGLFIAANQHYAPPPVAVDLGDPSLVVVKDPASAVLYLQLYFTDTITSSNGAKNKPTGSKQTNLSVARVAMLDFLKAAFASQSTAPLPPFEKYYIANGVGSWTQPGMYGLSTGILASPFYDPFNPDINADTNIIYNNTIQRYVAVFDNTHRVAYAESPDGMNWSQPVTLLGFDLNSSQNNHNKHIAQYATIVSQDADPAVITSDRFYIYYNEQMLGEGWNTANLFRLQLKCTNSQ